MNFLSRPPNIPANITMVKTNQNFLQHGASRKSHHSDARQRAEMQARADAAAEGTPDRWHDFYEARCSAEESGDPNAWRDHLPDTPAYRHRLLSGGAGGGAPENKNRDRA